MRRKLTWLLSCWSLLAAVLACNLVRGERTSSVPTAPATATTQPDFHVDLKQSEDYLSSDELEGRLVGTPGIEKAGHFIAETFAKLGLQPAPGQADYFQSFDMTSGVKVDPSTSIAAGEGKAWLGAAKPKLSSDYQPMSFSAEGEYSGKVAFAGYSVTDKDHNYDDYADLDVKGKVVLAMRFEPRDEKGQSRVTGKQGEWSPLAAILEKAKSAADHGAVALLLVNPPAKGAQGDALMPFARMFQFDRAGIPIIQIKQELADDMMKAGTGESLAVYEQNIDADFKPRSADLEGVTISGNVAFKKETKDVRNVIGVLPGKGDHANECVVIGAHYDHLGHGGPGSLAPLSKSIHHGADDNASGTTAIMALADRFAHMGPQARTLIFVTFTGEEEGLIGSHYFVEHPPVPLDRIVSMLNLDMVGRVRDEKLSIGGTGTATGFEKLMDEAIKDSPLKLQSYGKGGLGPSDHMSFGLKKIPVLFFFSGLHLDYHRPTDTADKINFEGMQQVVDLGVKVITALAQAPREQYVSTFDSQMQMSGGGGPNRVTLGVVPDYSDDTIKGVRISGTTPRSPADAAGLKEGDTLIQFNDTKLNSLMDLSNELQKGKPGDKVHIRLLRDGKEIETDAVLAERKG